MKVGFIAPQSISVTNGGVRTQALMTAKHLKDLGVQVHFISPWDDISMLDIDLFHVFSASVENIGIISRLRSQNKKIVLSPVIFSNRSGANIKRFLSFEEKLTSISNGIRSEFSQKKEICKQVDILLPNTSEESKLISTAFRISDYNLHVIPNGVETRFSKSNSSAFEEKTGLKDFILCVGQVSTPRKNVLKLLESFSEINENLVIIGEFNDSEYSRKCISIAAKNDRIHLMNTLDHNSELLASAYAACKVFVLPSQFETPGIAALEAGLAGANIVITEVGGTRDYFGNYVNYVSPYSKKSIKSGIQKALEKTKSNELKDHILQNFTWDKVAEQTLDQYKKVLQ